MSGHKPGPPFFYLALVSAPLSVQAAGHRLEDMVLCFKEVLLEALLLDLGRLLLGGVEGLSVALLGIQEARQLALHLAVWTLCEFSRSLQILRLRRGWTVWRSLLSRTGRVRARASQRFGFRRELAPAGTGSACSLREVLIIQWILELRVVIFSLYNRQPLESSHPLRPQLVVLNIWHYLANVPCLLGVQFAHLTTLELGEAAGDRCPSRTHLGGAHPRPRATFIKVDSQVRCCAFHGHHFFA